MPQKKRLSDVTRKATTDRTSMLLSGLVPPAPVAERTKPVEQPQPVDPPAVHEVTAAPVAPEKAATVAAPEAALKVDRPKRSKSSSINDIFTLPAPEGVRCTRPIMLTEDHHELLRNLSHQHRKPMTVILYNLLEYMNQATQQQPSN